jgi:hypothetical protein
LTNLVFLLSIWCSELIHQYKLDWPVFDPSPIWERHHSQLVTCCICQQHHSHCCKSEVFSMATLQILHLTSCSFNTISTASRWASQTESANRCIPTAVRIQGNCSALYRMSQVYLYKQEADKQGSRMLDPYVLQQRLKTRDRCALTG